MLTFEQWLIKYKNRNSPLGDLASDYIREGCPVPFDLDHLWKVGACDDAIRTYKEAQKTYKRMLKRQEDKNGKI